MKPCPACNTANAAENRFCQQCGRPFDADATVLYAGQPILPAGELPRATPLELLFAAKPRLVVGRAPDCDICLPHPTVSRYHALLERTPEGLRLRDLASVNGTWLNGLRITDPVPVHDRERVGIGPFLFSLVGGVIYVLDSSRSLRLEARDLEKVVPTSAGPRKLLDGISLVVEPGELVVLLGPSGSGKSTLMDCLNGRRRATGGKVLANGEDFYRHFDNFRQSLGYVPQKDIVHGQLTVARALYYTARLRLPTDTDAVELQGRVEAVLTEMELGPHRDTLVANLSGGQVKRVSLGAELLARPCLLYIDEATSGLDAGTEGRMMALFRRLADEGKSILCITHNVDHVERCHLALVLARGKVVYLGPPSEAPAYFGVGKVSDIYDRLAERDLSEWENEFAASSLYRQFVLDRLATGPNGSGVSADPGPFTIVPRQRALATTPSPAEGQDAVASPPAPAPEPAEGKDGTSSLSAGAALAQRFRELGRRGKFREWLEPLAENLHQFRVLTARYVELVWGDRRSLRLLLLQAPIVALFLLAGFANKPYQDEIPAPRALKESERETLQEVFEEVGIPEGETGDLVRGLLRSQTPIIPYRMIINPRYTYMLLNILVIAVFWFGCNNAAKEIVKEEAVYGRERAVNLCILPYLGSKFVVLSVISAVQVLLIMLVIFGSLELLHVWLGWQVPPGQYCLSYLPQYGVLVLLSMTGVAFGLLLSSCVASPDRANALLPYVLIPQIILGGGLLPVRTGLLHWMAMSLSPVYWAYRAVHRGGTSLPEAFPFRETYDDSVWLACAALGLQTAMLLLATAWCLRRKDVA